MNLKIVILTIYLNVVWRGALATSYSTVYVQGGKDTVPVNYIKYGAPAVSISNAQLAQLTAAPIGSVLPLPPASTLVSPCVAPCVTVPGQSVAPISPVTSAKIVSTPVIVASSNDDKSGYEYAYVVYDDKTGDQKAQRELSDGTLVQGQYALTQPDGYVRQVQYTADDLRGFNAVVKNFLPVPPAVQAPKTPINRDNRPDKKPKKKEDLKKKPVKSESLVEPPKGTISQKVDPNLTEFGQEFYTSGKKGVDSLKPATTPKPAPKTTPKRIESTTPNAETVVSYNDIIRCIQAAIKKTQGTGAAVPSTSALTYIIVPPNGVKPC